MINAHEAGFASLQLCHQHSVFISSGVYSVTDPLTLDVVVWPWCIADQNSTREKDWRPVRRLQGHTAQLVDAIPVEAENHIVSGDEQGCFRVWSFQTFHCLQVFHANSARLGILCSFLVLPPTGSVPAQIVAAGQNIQQFYLESIVTTEPLICAIHNPTCDTIITVSGRFPALLTVIPRDRRLCVQRKLSLSGMQKMAIESNRSYLGLLGRS